MHEIRAMIEIFRVLFTSGHCINQPRQTILQWAVPGKRLIQDLNEEPEFALPERIAPGKKTLLF